MIEYFIIGILTALLIGQQAFWAFICFKLNNKLMSRNFAEYEQAKNINKKIHVAPSPMPPDEFADDLAAQANKTFGLI